MCFGTTSFPVMRIQAMKRLASRVTGLVTVLQAAMRMMIMTSTLLGLHSAALRRAEAVLADTLAHCALAVVPHRNRWSVAIAGGKEVEDGVAVFHDMYWMHSRLPVLCRAELRQVLHHLTTKQTALQPGTTAVTMIQLWSTLT